MLTQWYGLNQYTNSHNCTAPFRFFFTQNAHTHTQADQYNTCKKKKKLTTAKNSNDREKNLHSTSIEVKENTNNIFVISNICIACVRQKPYKR